MRFLPVLLVAFAVLCVACSDAAETTATATPAGSPSLAAVPPSPAAMPTAASPTAGTTTAAPTATATPAPTPDAAATPSPTPEAALGVVQVDFPDWIDESPEMAVRIAAADVIAQARFLSLEHAIRESEYHGHVVELRYRFEVAGYLKGDGPGEVTVLLESGPVYTSYPDAFRLRTEEEARDLAATWPAHNRAQFVDRGDGILLLTRRGPDGDLHFGRVDDGEGQGGEPVIGEAWLDESDDSTYLHLLSGSGGGLISLGELSARIEEIDAYMDGQYASCVFGSLIWRSRVRDQIEGTYRELTVGGFAEPEPFPRLVATLDAGESDDADVLNIVRPPFQGPRFSDYWLDGPDKDLFETDPLATFESSHEWVYPAQALPEGEYRIHYAQYHSALPCGYGAAWIVRDATELVVQVADFP